MGDNDTGQRNLLVFGQDGTLRAEYSTVFSFTAHGNGNVYFFRRDDSKSIKASAGETHIAYTVQKSEADDSWDGCGIAYEPVGNQLYLRTEASVQLYNFTPRSTSPCVQSWESMSTGRPSPGASCWMQWGPLRPAERISICSAAEPLRMASG